MKKYNSKNILTHKQKKEIAEFDKEVENLFKKRYPKTISIDEFAKLIKKEKNKQNK